MLATTALEEACVPTQVTVKCMFLIFSVHCKKQWYSLCYTLAEFYKGGMADDRTSISIWVHWYYWLAQCGEVNHDEWYFGTKFPSYLPDRKQLETVLWEFIPPGILRWFYDTPGIHKPKGKLHRVMVKSTECHSRSGRFAGLSIYNP